MLFKAHYINKSNLCLLIIWHFIILIILTLKLRPILGKGNNLYWQYPPTLVFNRNPDEKQSVPLQLFGISNFISTLHFTAFFWSFAFWLDSIVYFVCSLFSQPIVWGLLRAAWSPETVFFLFTWPNVSVISKLQHSPPPRQPPGHLTFLEIIVQIPPYQGQNAVQMPHTRVHSGDQMFPPRGHFTGTKITEGQRKRLQLSNKIFIKI